MTVSVLAEPKPRWPTGGVPEHGERLHRTDITDSVGLSSAKGDVAAHGDAVRERGVSCDGEHL